MKSPTVLGLVFALATAVPTVLQGAVFTDDFEGAALDPFWSLSVGPEGGVVTFPSTAQAFSGRQSVQLQTTPTTRPAFGAGIQHIYASPTYGRFSVMMYDSFAGNYNGNYVLMTLYQESGRNVSVGIMDWDGGVYYTGGTVTQPSLIGRTTGWHRLSIVDLADELTVAIDGTTIYSADAGYPIDLVSLSQYGPSWRPSGIVSYYDDFSGASDIPEPSGAIIWGALGGFFVAIGCCRRKRRTV